MSKALIRTENVSKKYCRGLKKSLWYGLQDIAGELAGRNGKPKELRPDEFWAVKDVSFEVEPGECLGLIGHNGAGKTTLLKMLNGLLKPDSGSIAMRGRVGALIALGAGFNPVLTGRENIYVNGSVLGMTKAEIDAKLDSIIDYADIREFINAPVQSYSSGMAVRLGFAIAAHCHPDILLLDEVLAVGDIGFQAKCFNTLAQFREAGTSFILVSHNMHLITRYSARVLYLRKGRTAWLGDTDTAVGMFTRDMNSQQHQEEAGATDWSKVYGSGKVALKRAVFLNKLGYPVEEIHCGDPVTLRLEYECAETEVICPFLDLIIRDRDGIFFQATNLAFRESLGTLHGRGEIEVAFDSLPANNGRLLFFVAIMNEVTKEVYDWKRNIPLIVQGQSNSQGRVHLACRWSSAQF